MLQLVDDLMAIGEFSERSGLSAKRLRTYAAEGLLAPAAVDPFRDTATTRQASWLMPGSLMRYDKRTCRSPTSAPSCVNHPGNGSMPGRDSSKPTRTAAECAHPGPPALCGEPGPTFLDLFSQIPRRSS